MSQVEGVTLGLCYLHEHEIIHGDVRSVSRTGFFHFNHIITSAIKPNVLIDRLHQPQISDFGLARAADTTSFQANISSTGHKGAARWQGPELLEPSDDHDGHGKFTTKSDVYAYACVIIEASSLCSFFILAPHFVVRNPW